MSERNINITIHHEGVSKDTVLKLSKINKERITKLVRKELGFSRSTKFKLTRKSKRSKSYVDLVEPADYRALNRSLDVKNHLKLKVEDVHTDDDSGDNEKDAEKEQAGDDIEIKRAEYDDLVRKLDDIKGSIKKVSQQFSKQQQKQQQANEAPPVYSSANDIFGVTANVIHPTIYCDVCNPLDNSNGRIKGTRYQCRDCFNYDLCEDCYLSGKASQGHHTNHSMSRISIIPKDSFVGGHGFEAQQKPRPQPQKEVHEDPKDAIYLDINVDASQSKNYQDKIVDFVGRYDDVSRLSKVLDKIDAYDSLLSLTDGDEELLSTIIKSYIETQKFKNVVGDKISKNPNLSVEVSKVDQTLVFHLRNKSCLLTPKNLSLIMNFMGKNDTNPENVTKFNLSMGPHSIYPNGHKRLYYNLNGFAENNFDIKANKFTIELIDENNKLYASGVCTNGSGIVELNDELEVTKDLSNITIQDEDDDEDEIDEDRSPLDVTASSTTSDTKETSSVSGSSDTSSPFVTPSNSTFITQAVLQNSKETLIDIESTTVPDEYHEVEEASGDEGSITTRETSNPRSSTATLTPEYDDAVVSTDLSEEDVDDYDSFAEDYEVLSTDDFSE